MGKFILQFYKQCAVHLPQEAKNEELERALPKKQFKGGVSIS